MQKIAVLVIAAVNQPVYLSYIRNYWSAAIHHTKQTCRNIDIFLLLEHGTPMSEFKSLGENVIVDDNADLSCLCDPKLHFPGFPSILSKTICALDLLQDHYDVFFRTNLSSLIKLSAFDDYIQSQEKLSYSSAWVWNDGLREDLQLHNRVGPGKSIRSLSELLAYEGNSFASGAGYFLNAEEAKSLVNRREMIRYDIVDDVSVGLMFPNCKILSGFSAIMTADQTVDDTVSRIERTPACHIRLQHFPAALAENLWGKLKNKSVWQ